MEVKVNAVMLRATDYKENDKILTLLTAEKGKITAGIRGVKKAGAKLKFAAQPFCFAEYVLARTGERYTVVGASENESFYDLRTDINKFYAACAAMEAADALTYEGEDCSRLFSSTVRLLSQICVGDERSALISYLLEALRYAGYGISLENCPYCRKELINENILRFDFPAGVFTCRDCGDGEMASGVTYNVMRKLSSKPFAEEFITPDGEKRALRILREYIPYKTGSALKSLAEYIRLI